MSDETLYRRVWACALTLGSPLWCTSENPHPSRCGCGYKYEEVQKEVVLDLENGDVLVSADEKLFVVAVATTSPYTTQLIRFSSMGLRWDHYAYYEKNYGKLSKISGPQRNITKLLKFLNDAGVTR